MCQAQLGRVLRQPSRVSHLHGVRAAGISAGTSVSARSRSQRTHLLLGHQAKRDREHSCCCSYNPSAGTAPSSPPISFLESILCARLYVCSSILSQEVLTEPKSLRAC